MRLAQAYQEMGCFEKAVQNLRQAEELMDAPHSGSGGVDLTVRQGLYITMACALEGLGRLDECGRYRDMALELVSRIGHVSGPVMTCYCRRARMLQQEGKLAEAEEAYNLSLRFYVQCIEKTSSQGWAGDVRHLVPGLRSLVQLKRQMGKEAEARALEQELDETEAIMQSKSTAALEEVRAELRAEAAAMAGVGGAAGGAGGRGQRRQQQGGQHQQQQQQGEEQQQKKKPTRKQQKRKAAQRRKQAEAATAAEGTVTAGGGGSEAVAAAADEDGEEGTEDVLEAALEELGLEAEEAEPKPEPEPEPEECAICLNDLPLPGEEEGGAVLLACSHIFHALCLERWKDKCLEKAVPYTCAMCRAVVVVAATPAHEP